MTAQLFGRPIEGDPQPTRKPVEQGPDQDFLAALDGILAVEGVESVKWDQYTPYFNDGDACEFSVYDARVKVTGGDEEAGDYEDGFYDSYSLYEYIPDANGQIDWRGNPDKKWVDFNGISGEKIDEELEKFNRVLGSGRHDVLLGNTFGDHAEITATKAGFSVDFYEHD